MSTNTVAAPMYWCGSLGTISQAKIGPKILSALIGQRLHSEIVISPVRNSAHLSMAMPCMCAVRSGSLFDLFFDEVAEFRRSYVHEFGHHLFELCRRVVNCIFRLPFLAIAVACFTPRLSFLSCLAKSP